MTDRLESVSIGDFANDHEIVVVAQSGHIINPNPKPVAGFVVYRDSFTACGYKDARTEVYECEDCREETRWEGTIAVASTHDAALDIALAFGKTVDTDLSLIG